MKNGSAISEALEKLSARDKKLVKLGYFVGLTAAEAAKVLGISAPTEHVLRQRPTTPDGGPRLNCVSQRFYRAILP